MLFRSAIIPATIGCTVQRAAEICEARQEKPAVKASVRWRIQNRLGAVPCQLEYCAATASATAAIGAAGDRGPIEMTVNALDQRAVLRAGAVCPGKTEQGGKGLSGRGKRERSAGQRNNKNGTPIRGAIRTL